MRKLLLLSSLLMFNYCVWGQSSPAAETPAVHESEFALIPKLGFGKFSQSGSIPLYGFASGVDALFHIRLSKRFHLQTGVGYFEFYGNSVSAGDATSLRNSYVHVPLKLKSERIVFENQAKHERLCSAMGIGFYANSLINQKTGTVSGSSDKSNLGGNYGFLIQWGVKYVLADKFNVEFGYQYQHDFTEMNKDGIDRKLDNLNTIYLEFGL